PSCRKNRSSPSSPVVNARNAAMKRLSLLVVPCLLVAGIAVAQKPGDADFLTPASCARHQQKVSAVKAGHYDLALIGDSITQTVGDMEGEWTPLKAVWDKHYAPRHALNLGYSGYRTEQILWNLQNGELDFAQPPKVVTLLV